MPRSFKAIKDKLVINTSFQLFCKSVMSRQVLKKPSSSQRASLGNSRY